MPRASRSQYRSCAGHPGLTINGVTTPQAPRPGRSHRKKAQNRLLAKGLLTAVAAFGMALIVVIMVPAVLGATSSRQSGKPTPTVTVTVKVPAPQPAMTVTVTRPGPTITLTVQQPAPTVTIHCRHPGRGCGHG